MRANGLSTIRSRMMAADPHAVEDAGHHGPADAWEAGHRMPFIVRWPGSIKPRTSSKQTISFVDILATFAELTETELPDSAGPDSFSFLPVLRGEQPDDQTVRDTLVVRTRAKSGIRTVR